MTSSSISGLTRKPSKQPDFFQLGRKNLSVRPFIATLFATTYLSLHGCNSQIRFYKEDQIEIISHQEQANGMVEIVFKAPLESMHYCAGANLQEEAGITRVSLIRCGINEKCVTDSPALDVSDGKSKIEIKSNSGHLIFVFEDGEKMAQ